MLRYRGEATEASRAEKCTINDRESPCSARADDVVAGKNSLETRVCSRPRPAGGCQNRWNGTSRQKRVSLASGRSACWRRGVVRIGGFWWLAGVVGVRLASSGSSTSIHAKWRDAGER